MRPAQVWAGSIISGPNLVMAEILTILVTYDPSETSKDTQCMCLVFQCSEKLLSASEYGTLSTPDADDHRSLY